MRLFVFVVFIALAAGAPVAKAAGITMPNEKRSSAELTMDEFKTVKPGLLLMPDDLQQTDSQEDTMAVIVSPGLTITDKPLTFDEILQEYTLGNYSRILPSLNLLVNNGQHGAEELLGIMYKSGYGVEKDFKKGFELLSKAADANRALAQHHLGVMYYMGEGVPAPDKVISLMWLHIAIAHYPNGAEKTRAIQDRDSVLVLLSRREKERALDLARDWLAKKGESHLLDLQ